MSMILVIKRYCIQERLGYLVYSARVKKCDHYVQESKTSDWYSNVSLRRACFAASPLLLTNAPSSGFDTVSMLHPEPSPKALN